MPPTHRYSPELLRALRNNIPIGQLIADLGIVSKLSDGYYRFLCPQCGDFHTATNPLTNLARCFRCGENFNPIDLVMITRGLNFTEAVQFLLPYSNPP